MNIEYEATFLDINKDDTRNKIKAIGGICTHSERMMKRVIFKSPIDPENAYIRVRDEGDKVTVTFKQTSDNESHIESVRELETVVQDFDIMRQILLKSGLQQKAYQETLRETWKIDGVQAMIDTWPGLNSFIEIEGDSEQIVKIYSEKLGFDYSKAVFGTVGAVYLKELGLQPEQVNNIPEITFQSPPKGNK